MKDLATNKEILEFLELPDSIVTALQSKQPQVYQPARNQFLNSLVNKILYQVVDSLSYANPFKKYDGFKITYGDTIENIWVRQPKGYKFNPDATNPFAKSKPEVVTMYATINYEMQYKITIEDALLRRAALNEYGFTDLINKILGTLPQQKEIDEYFATLTMLNNSEIYANGFESVEVAEGATDEERAKLVTSKIVDVYTAMGLPSTKHNALGELQVSNKSDLLLIIKQKLLNSINLDFLSGVFNLSKTQLLDNILPVESFQTENESGQTIGEDIDFAILDTRGFDNHPALEDGGELYNPEGKYTNHYLNDWKVIAYKYSYNARAFKVVAAAGA